MDRGVWRATVHGVAELDTTEATFTFFEKFQYLINIHYRKLG